MKTLKAISLSFRWIYRKLFTRPYVLHLENKTGQEINNVTFLESDSSSKWVPEIYESIYDFKVTMSNFVAIIHKGNAFTLINKNNNHFIIQDLYGVKIQLSNRYLNNFIQVKTEHK